MSKIWTPSILFRRFSILVTNLFALWWTISEVFILMEAPSPISANVIIEWPHISGKNTESTKLLTEYTCNYIG